MPDSTLSAALKEAYASAKGIIYHTLELRHPSFSQPIRVVMDRANLTAGMEATAPSDPSLMVEFIAFSFEFQKPEISPNGVPQMTITMDNAGREISSNIELSVSSPEVVKATYREYIDSDLSVPQNDPPIHMNISGISVTMFKVTATASFPSMMNRRFPTMEYSTENFPGLAS